MIQALFVGMAFSSPLGPTNIEIIRRGMKKGFWSALLFGLGGILAETLYFLVIFFGLSPFLGNTVVKLTLSALGTLVLFSLSASAFNDLIQKKNEGSIGKLSESDAFSGFMVTLTNPTTLPEWIGMYGIIFVGQSSQKPLNSFLMLLLGTLIMAVFYSALAHLSGKHLPLSLRRGISLISGFSLLGFSLFFGHQFIKLLAQV